MGIINLFKSKATRQNEKLTREIQTSTATINLQQTLIGFLLLVVLVLAFLFIQSKNNNGTTAV